MPYAIEFVKGIIIMTKKAQLAMIDFSQSIRVISDVINPPINTKTGAVAGVGITSKIGYINKDNPKQIEITTLDNPWKNTCEKIKMHIQVLTYTV